VWLLFNSGVVGVNPKDERGPRLYAFGGDALNARATNGPGINGPLSHGQASTN